MTTNDDMIARLSKERQDKINKAVEEEVKKYTQNESVITEKRDMPIKKINEQLNKFIETEYSMEDLFGYLEPANSHSNYILAENNEVYISLKDGKILVRNELLNDERMELTPEVCKNKEALLKTLKDAGLLHKETVDILRWSNIKQDSKFLGLYGCIEKGNKNINVTTQSGGRGTTMTLIHDISDDPIKNAINASGINISNYEVIRETSKGTLVLAKVRPYDNKKAFLFKDGKLKTATTATLCAIIKEL